MRRTKMSTVFDGDFGVVAAVTDANTGEIVATASSSHCPVTGLEMIWDEGSIFEAGGHLLPADLRDEAVE